MFIYNWMFEDLREKLCLIEFEFMKIKVRSISECKPIKDETEFVNDH